MQTPKTAKISGLMFGSLIFGGCSLLNVYSQPDFTASLPDKKIELYDHDKDGKWDELTVKLINPQEEQIFKKIIGTATITYNAKDRDFNGSWETLWYLANDNKTNNTLSCSLFDENNDRVYERGVLNLVVFNARGIDITSVFFRDIDNDSIFDLRILDRTTTTDSYFLEDFNKLGIVVQDFIKRELELIKRYKK